MECIRCKKTVTTEELVRDKTRQSGYRNVCKPCHAAYKKKYYKPIKLEKLNARDSEIRVISHIVAKDFLNRYHSQKFTTSTVYLGLYIEDDLTMVMSFRMPRFNKKYQWELIRLCTKSNTLIRGGASKLFKYFVEHYKPDNVISYSFLEDESSGAVYEFLGFKFLKVTIPGYGYEKDGVFLDRTRCQKSMLPRLLGDSFNPQISERQNMINCGFTKVFTKRNKVFLWQKGD